MGGRVAGAEAGGNGRQCARAWAAAPGFALLSESLLLRLTSPTCAPPAPPTPLPRTQWAMEEYVRHVMRLADDPLEPAVPHCVTRAVLISDHLDNILCLLVTYVVTLRKTLGTVFGHAVAQVRGRAWRAPAFCQMEPLGPGGQCCPVGWTACARTVVAAPPADPSPAPPPLPPAPGLPPAPRQMVELGGHEAAGKAVVAMKDVDASYSRVCSRYGLREGAPDGRGLGRARSRAGGCSGSAGGGREVGSPTAVYRGPHRPLCCPACPLAQPRLRAWHPQPPPITHLLPFPLAPPAAGPRRQASCMPAWCAPPTCRHPLPALPFPLAPPAAGVMFNNLDLLGRVNQLHPDAAVEAVMDDPEVVPHWGPEST